MQAGILRFNDTDNGCNLINAVESVYDTKAICFEWDTDHIQGVDVVYLSGGAFWAEDVMLKNIEIPAILALKRFSAAGGLVIGFGEGFRLLCNVGLLPGKFEQNKNKLPIVQNVYIKVDNSKSPISTLIDKTGHIELPVSTLYGQYRLAERELVLMHQYHQIIYRFCNNLGRTTEKVNYTGSVDNIAAVCNETGTIYGMLPYPDRAFDEETGNDNGRLIFESVLADFS
jgi:phosphoribosylformylglycinamidine synthase